MVAEKGRSERARHALIVLPRSVHLAAQCGFDQQQIARARELYHWQLHSLDKDINRILMLVFPSALPPAGLHESC